jgi:hypothetical protein
MVKIGNNVKINPHATVYRIVAIHIGEEIFPIEFL